MALQLWHLGGNELRQLSLSPCITQLHPKSLDPGSRNQDWRRGAAWQKKKCKKSKKKQENLIRWTDEQKNCGTWIVLFQEMDVTATLSERSVSWIPSSVVTDTQVVWLYVRRNSEQLQTEVISILRPSRREACSFRSGNLHIHCRTVNIWLVQWVFSSVVNKIASDGNATVASRDAAICSVREKARWQKICPPNHFNALSTFSAGFF